MTEMYEKLTNHVRLQIERPLWEQALRLIGPAEGARAGLKRRVVSFEASVIAQSVKHETSEERVVHV